MRRSWYGRHQKLFPNVDTAFTFVAGRAWQPLFAIVGFTLVVANFGSGMGAQLGAARLLYGMGRSNALPKKFFGAVDPKRRVPRNNVVFVGALALAGAFLLPAIAGAATGYELGANLLNFGALIAFMGVNAAAFVRYFVREEKKKLSNFLPPVLGFFICLVLWWNLSTKARIVGAIWMAVSASLSAPGRRAASVANWWTSRAVLSGEIPMNPSRHYVIASPPTSSQRRSGKIRHARIP